MKKWWCFLFCVIVCSSFVFGVCGSVRPSGDPPGVWWSPRPTTAQEYVSAICGSGDSVYQAWCVYFGDCLGEVPCSFYGGCGSAPPIVLNEVQKAACLSADANNNCDGLALLGAVSASDCCSVLSVCCDTCVVSFGEFEDVLISAITSYFTSTPLLGLEELQDLIDVYFASDGVTVDLSGVGEYSGKPLCDTYNKAKGGVVPTCSDGLKNQGEVGVDCGGPCPTCFVNDECSYSTDCVKCGNSCVGHAQWSGVCGVPTADFSCSCVNGLCTSVLTTPIGNCFDGIQNQGETGVDCGGQCPPCSALTGDYSDEVATATRIPNTWLNGYYGIQTGLDKGQTKYFLIDPKGDGTPWQSPNVYSEIRDAFQGAYVNIYYSKIIKVDANGNEISSAKYQGMGDYSVYMPFSQDEYNNGYKVLIELLESTTPDSPGPAGQTHGITVLWLWG